MNEYKLDTGNSGNDETLFGRCEAEVIQDVLNRYEIDRLPEGWSISKVESMPQLPAEMLGVAYENGMGGLSVDLCDEDDDIEEMMDQHMDPEMVCVVPYEQYPMDLIKAAPKMQDVLEVLCFEFEREGKISQVTYELAKRALAKAIGSEWPQGHGTTEYDNMPPMQFKKDGEA